MSTKVIVILSMFLSGTVLGSNQDDVHPRGYGVGVGAASSTTDGDFVQRRRMSLFQLGFNIENADKLLLFEGYGDTSYRNEASLLRLIAGAGTSNLKVGIGFVTQKTSIPTATPDPGQMVTTDPARLSEISVSTVPLYLRWHPVLNRHVVFYVDGYYGLYSSGSMEVPVKAAGLDAVMKTEPQRAGGTWGYGAAVAFRVAGDVALRFGYQVGHGQMDRKRTGFHGDVFGAYNGATVPEIEFTNRMLTATLVVGL